jgi:hypothetical protein
MIEAHERIVEGLYEARRHQGERPEFHRGENKQSHRAEERNKADRINQINIEFLNMIMPVAVIEVAETGKPDPKNSDKGSIFLDIIEMILELIAKGAKAVFSKRKGKPVNS